MKTRRALIFLFLVVSLLTAGCTNTTHQPTPELANNPTDSPHLTVTQTPTYTTSGPAQGTEWTITITRVIDGDTMEAEFPNGEIDTHRFLGVDTPETTLNRNSPDESGGIPDTLVAIIYSTGANTPLILGLGNWPGGQWWFG